RAVQFLRRDQAGDGGFPSLAGAGSNAQSTAFAVQGLLAAGVDPGSIRRRGASPLTYLPSLIAPDGHVRYSRGADQTPVWVTAEALMALESKALPVAAVARRTVTHPTRPRPRTATTSRASAPAGAATNPGPSATATRHHQAARA